MNRSEALELYQRLDAAFPTGKERTAATMELWVERLVGTSAELGRRAVDDVIDSWKLATFPPIGIFVEALDLRRQAWAERSPAPPSPWAALEDERPASKQTAAYWIAESRKLLAEQPGPPRKLPKLPTPTRRNGDPIAVGDALGEAVKRFAEANAAQPDVDETLTETAETLRDHALDDSACAHDEEPEEVF
jgi:hypothetical protein